MLLQTTVVRGAVLAAAQYAAVLVLDEIAHLDRAFAESARHAFGGNVRVHDPEPRPPHLRDRHASVLWIAFMLNSLRMLGPVTERSCLRCSLRNWTIGQVTISLGRMLGFAVAVWVAIYASRITQVLLRDDRAAALRAAARRAERDIDVANYAMVLIGLLIGASILGIGLSNLTLIVGALGVGIGFGLQNVVNNFVSGFILIFERSVQIGDTIQLSDLQGNVTQIGLRASRLRTFNGSEVIIPNGELISNRLINWTMSDRRRRSTLRSASRTAAIRSTCTTCCSEILDERRRRAEGSGARGGVRRRSATAR